MQITYGERRFRFTPHSTAARKAMKLTERAVQDIVSNALVTWDSHPDKYGPTRKVLANDTYAVVLDDLDGIVVTVLYRRKHNGSVDERWDRDEERQRRNLA